MSTNQPTCRLCFGFLGEAKLELCHPVSSEILSQVSDKRVRTEFRDCMSCGTVNAINDDPRRLLGYGSTWLRYTEPVQHFPDVLSLHRNGSTAAVSRVVGLSEKDQSLVDLLVKSGLSGDSRALFAVESQSWQALTPTDGNTMWIARRFLEHINDVSLVQQLLNFIIGVGDFIYIEMLDFDELQGKVSGLYLWPERTLYPKLNVVRALLESYGFEVSETRSYALQDNPFWWMLAERKEARCPSQMSALRSPLRSTTDVVSHFTRTISDISSSLAARTTGRSVAIFGVNHKSQTLAFCLHESGWDVSFHDGSPQKVGRYSGPFKIAPFTELPQSTDCVLFFFKNQTAVDLGQDIIRRMPQVLIFDFSVY